MKSMFISIVNLLSYNDVSISMLTERLTQNFGKASKFWFAASSGDSYGVPPVPIPNTVVKPLYVESTWLETAWEDR